MPQSFYDIIVRINVISFIITIIDKMMEGRLKTLFYLSAFCFGGGGATIGCLVAKHRTREGGLSVAFFFTIVQFGILWLLEKIFG